MKDKPVAQDDDAVTPDPPLVGHACSGMSGTPRIWFLRHGQTDWNAQGRLQGHRDIPLNEHGRRQAASLAGLLRDVAAENLIGADFVARPLLRARETIEIVRAKLDLDRTAFRVDPRLREIGFGEWEGLTWSEIRRRDPSGAADRDRDRWRFRPRGAGSESYADLAVRVTEAVRELDRPTVLVAHGGVARALLVALGHLESSVAVRMGIRQGRILVFDPRRWRWV